MSKKGIRLTLDVSNELNETLERMASDSHGTKSDVLRKSIALYDLALLEKKKNRHLGIFDSSDKMVKEIIGI